MNDLDLMKVIATVFTSVGSVLAAKVNGIRYQKLRADLLKQFDEALKARNKFQVYELFYMITNQRMSFGEIEKIMVDEKSFESISALSNYPGIYEYKDGKLSYKKLFKSCVVRWLTKISFFMYSILMLFLVVILALTMVNINNSTGFVFALIFLALFSYIGYTSAKLVYDSYKIEKKYFQNHSKTMDVSTQFALAETSSGELLQTQFPELVGKVIPLLRESQVKFKKTTLKSVTAYSSITEEALETFNLQYGKKGRAILSVYVEIKDSDNTVTCIATFTWFIQKIEQ